MGIQLGKMIYVTGPSRSGTSMIAGVFGVHDIWTGPTAGPAKINQKGFWESNKFKDLVQQAQPGWEREWFHYMVGNGYKGGPWMVKSGVQYLERVKPFSPIIVKCHRDKAKIIESRNRIKWPPAPIVVERAQEVLARTIGYTITSDKVANRDFSEFLPVFEEVGVEFDYDKAYDWVDPKLFHNRRSDGQQ